MFQKIKGCVCVGLYRLFMNVYTRDCFIELEIRWRTLGMLCAFVGFINYSSNLVICLGE